PHLLVVRHIDRDRSVIVVDVQTVNVQAAGARSQVGVDFAAIVERRSAKNFVESSIVAYLEMVAEILPVHTRGLGGNQSRDDQKQHQENATDANSPRRLPVALRLFVF